MNNVFWMQSMYHSDIWYLHTIKDKDGSPVMAGMELRLTRPCGYEARFLYRSGVVKLYYAKTLSEAQDAALAAWRMS